MPSNKKLSLLTFIFEASLEEPSEGMITLKALTWQHPLTSIWLILGLRPTNAKGRSTREGALSLVFKKST